MVARQRLTHLLLRFALLECLDGVWVWDTIWRCSRRFARTSTEIVPAKRTGEGRPLTLYTDLKIAYSQSAYEKSPKTSNEIAPNLVGPVLAR
jgi:hypothetical protein